MASNFRIYCHQTRDSLHIKLTGDFDGSSAYELINSLKEYRGIARSFFILTGISEKYEIVGEQLLMTAIDKKVRFVGV